MYKTISIFGLLLLAQELLPNKSFAQLPSIKFEIITSEDGLPSTAVYSAMRDKKGFMWFGTRLCPVRYDGSTFQSFTAIETTFVTGIADDRENKIWFASSENIVCNIDATTYKINLVTGTNNGGDFYIDSKGAGWYSDRTGVNRLNLKTGKQIHYPFAINKFIWNKGSFAEDTNHTLWVLGRDNGLFRYDEKSDTLLCMLGGDCADHDRNEQILLTKGCIDRQGFLWMGSYNKGLIKCTIYISN